MSTTGPGAAREIAAEAGRRGADFLDAPVSGSTALAEQGTLTTMVGGPAAAFERARPVLAALTARQLHDACAAGLADADFSCVASLLRSGPAGEPGVTRVKRQLTN